MTNDELKNKVQKLFIEILESNANHVMNLACPGCLGPLRIQITSSDRGSMSVECSDCDWCLHRNGGGPKKPLWVSELGLSIETLGNCGLKKNEEVEILKEDGKGCHNGP